MSTFMVATAFVVRARSSSEFLGRSGKFVFNVSPQRKGVLTQAIVVAKQSFHHVHSKQLPCDSDRK
jgi:hypothetical protein